MNWDAIGAIGEILGAVAVFASLTYLAIQIKVTSRQFQAQLEENIQSKVFEAYEPFYQGRNGEIMFTGLNDPENLSAIDYFTFDLLLRRHSGVISTLEEKVRNKEIGEEFLNPYTEHYRKVIFSKPGGKQWLRDNPDAMGEAFYLFKDLVEGNA
jgi:hypothetical protein